MTVAARLVAGALLAGAAAGAAAVAVTLRLPPPAAAASPAAGAGTTESAATLYGQAMATTRSWSVHYASSSTQTSTSGAKVTLLETGDAGPASGTQSVYFSRGTLNGSISIAVIGGITYVKGNANGLENLAGLGPLEAAASAGKWIDFATKNPAFSQVVAGVRSHDVAQELALSGRLTLGRPRTIRGIAVLAIHGTQSSSGTTSGSGSSAAHPRAVLYVRAHGRHVPVEEDTLDATGRPDGALRVTYSNWGERVRPQAPLAAISFGPVTAT